MNNENDDKIYFNINHKTYNFNKILTEDLKYLKQMREYLKQIVRLKQFLNFLFYYKKLGTLEIWYFKAKWDQ